MNGICYASVIRVPMKVSSEQNLPTHWAARSNIHRKQKQAVWSAMHLLETKYGKIPRDVPVEVKLTRIGKRQMDYDNYVYALKWCRDAIADYLWPDKQLASRDDHDLVSWKYDQLRDKEYALVIEIRAYAKSDSPANNKSQDSGTNQTAFG